MQTSQNQPKEIKNKKKTGISRKFLCTILITLLIPATILFGVYVLKDRKFYFISVLILIYIMLPFFMVFEKRKPQARELVVIAVLTAIAVAGRAAFFMVPQFKPVVAIVIITGVCFGGESGFLVGALSAFASNFIFGQGAHTPWQMFCFGLIGFLAGVLYEHGILNRDRISLCIFGGLSTMIIYGGIINLGVFLMSGMPFTQEAILSTYTVAIPFDVIHAISTIIFLLLLSKPMIEKLERIKTKYGMIKGS